MPWRTVVPLAFVAAALGTLFGAAEVTTVAFAEEQGHTGAAGFLLALWAAGSLLAGLITGAIQWRRGPEVRVRLGAVGMMVAMAPLALIGSIPAMAAMLFVAGFAIAPTLIATMALTEQTVPAGRLTEGMAIIQTGIVAGVAPGATIGGIVIDAAGRLDGLPRLAGGGRRVAALAAADPPPPPGPRPRRRRPGRRLRPWSGAAGAAWPRPRRRRWRTRPTRRPWSRRSSRPARTAAR